MRVVNLPPQLESSPLDHFSVPGEVTCQISAVDLDGDTLSYELISPLDQGIILDPKTGLLTWKLEAAAVQELGETIEIQFAVKDDEGQKTTGSITHPAHQAEMTTRILQLISMASGVNFVNGSRHAAFDNITE